MPGMTCHEPTVKVKGVVSEYCSNTFPSGKVATKDTVIVSHTWTRSDDEHHANTPRVRINIARYTRDFFIDFVKRIKTLLEFFFEKCFPRLLRSRS